MQKTKQMIVVNATLKPSTQKMIAQMTQASDGAFRAADPEAKKMWLVTGRPKVFAKALGDDDFQDLLSKAELYSLPLYRVTESNATVPSAIACLGIGPVCETQIEQLTMLLDLYGWVRQNALNKVSLR